MTPTAPKPASTARLTRDRDEIRRLFFELRTRHDVAQLLEVPYMHLVHILYRSPRRYPYSHFTISKKSGGVRAISVPHNSLKLLQAKLNEVLQIVYAAKPAAHGFVAGRSILTNALAHTGKRYVLNIDLEDFFPSVHFGRVRGALMASPYGLTSEPATTIAQLCCTEDGLPQGAPSSPMISNLVCARLDGDLQRLAKKYKCTYTRYADDITFSTTLPRFPGQLASRGSDSWTPGDLEIGQELLGAIESNDFSINRGKCRLQFRDCHQEVTGLTVNKFPNVQRRLVRQVRAMLHAWERYGYDGAEKEYIARFKRASRNPEYQDPSFGRVVRGKLDFIKMVRGGSDPTFRRLWNRLHKLDSSFAPSELEVVEAPTAPPVDLQWEYWFDQYRGFIYHVETKKGGKTYGGTAFLWTNRLLATCSHCLDGVSEISPPFPSGAPVADVAYHADTHAGVDVALVRMAEPLAVPHRPFPVRNDPLQPGEQIAVLGFPSIPGVQPSCTIRVGIVESRSTDYRGRIDKIIISAGVAGGFSGGPVIDRGGKLVAIVTGKSWELTAANVPAEPFRHVLPVRYLSDIAEHEHHVSA